MTDPRVLDGHIVADDLSEVGGSKARPLSFTVKPGSVTALLGSDGAGRTRSLR